MEGERSVLVLHDERMTHHEPDSSTPFLADRLDRRVRAILASLDVEWSYPEHPGRLSAVLDQITRQPINGLQFGTGRPATREELARVHATAYLDDIETYRGKQAWLDVDTTAVSPGSVEAAEVAAGTAIAAVEAVVKGEVQHAFALIRPPGHHAESLRARGFCLFNNVAVAAAHAQATLGCERVLIIDWDAHHGNGTQSIFWADPDVLFFDVHRAAPFYPGSGHLEEVGGGRGEGYTVNVPVAPGTGDVAMLEVFRRILGPAARWFQPDLILVSAGFDAHQNDLALNMTSDGFGVLTHYVQELADELCEGRLAMVLEGGYNTDSLSLCVHRVLRVLAGGEVEEPTAAGMAAVKEAEEFHLSAFSEEG